MCLSFKAVEDLLFNCYQIIIRQINLSICIISFINNCIGIFKSLFLDMDEWYVLA